MIFLTILGVTKILCSFRFVLEGRAHKEIPESSRLELKQKFLANNFNLSDAEKNTSWLLNRGGIANLPLLLRHEETKCKILPEIPQCLSLLKTPCQTLSKALDISSTKS